jgi:hemerythrin superfamily protein
MTATSDMDVIDILTEDHHEVLGLISSIAQTVDPQARRDIADSVIAELVRHSVAEEMFVYPAMRDHLEDGDDVVQHDIGEHQELEETLKALEGVPGDSAEFDQLVARVGEQLRHHATDEESTQFPALRARVPKDQLVDLGRKVEAAKKAAPTRPHPAAPHSELFHKLAGPGVGLVDRLRDRLSGRAKNT